MLGGLPRAWRVLLLVQLAIMFLGTSIFSISLITLSKAISVADQQPFQEAPVQAIKGDKGDPGVVDYQKVDTIVQQKVDTAVSQLPKPKDGQNGTNGQNGQLGPPGSPGTSGKSAYQIWLDQGNQGTEQDFLNSLKGIPGQDAIGTPGREIELRSNPLNGNLEWRYVGDDSWQLLMKKCMITNTCEISTNGTGN